MRDTSETRAKESPPDADSRTTEEILLPLATVCSQGGSARNARTHGLKKRGESAPQRTLDWREIGEPAS